jgi:Domain of unknown function (DUF4349)
VDTEIRYLELVGDDLHDAARREVARPRERVNARNRRRRLARPVLAGAAALVVLAGVVGVFATRGGFSSDGSIEAVAGSTGAATGATGAEDGPRQGNVSDYLGPLATPAPQSTGPGDQTAPATEDSTRIIRTAQLVLVIPPASLDDRFAEAAEVAEDHDGFVQDSTTRRRSGEITMRVPAADFDEALADLRRLGDVEVQRIQGKDVTAEFVDLQARLRIAASRRDVLLDLMEEARSISQTIRVQNALDETQLRIEQIQGQIGLIDDRAALATIDLSLREVGADPEAEVETPSIPNAFERAVAGFVGVIATIVVGLGFLLPLLLIGGLVWLIVILVRRRRSA